MSNLVEQTRSNLDQAAETMRFNTRRLFMRTRTSFVGYRYTVRALSRMIDQLGAVMRSLTFIAREAARGIGKYLTPDRLEEPGSWPAYEALPADSRRLVEDIARAESELARLAH